MMRLARSSLQKPESATQVEPSRKVGLDRIGSIRGPGFLRHEPGQLPSWSLSGELGEGPCIQVVYTRDFSHIAAKGYVPST